MVSNYDYLIALSNIPSTSCVVLGLVALQSLDLSHNKIEKLDNKTHGLFEECLSLERVSLLTNSHKSRVCFFTEFH